MWLRPSSSASPIVNEIPTSDHDRRNPFAAGGGGGGEEEKSRHWIEIEDGWLVRRSCRK